MNDLVRLKDHRTGTVQFIGIVKGAKGKRCGISLDEPYTGECDGQLKGKRYFKCRKNKGIFVRKDKSAEVVKIVRRGRSVDKMHLDRESKTPRSRIVKSAVPTSRRSLVKQTSKSQVREKKSNFEVGLRVRCGTRLGTVKYNGLLDFVPGMTYLGVELDPVFKGKNDGSLKGKRYF